MSPTSRLIYVPVSNDEIQGTLTIPEKSSSIVVIAEANRRNRNGLLLHSLAETLNDAALSTLSIDLSTPNEELIQFQETHSELNIDFLVQRLSTVTQWVRGHSATNGMRIGYFGAEIAGVVALVTAARNGSAVDAIVCAGSRPNLVEASLGKVQPPTMLIVGGNDLAVIELNYQAAAELRTEHRLEIIPNTGQLFSESGSADIAAALTRDWFESYMVFAHPRAA